MANFTDARFETLRGQNFLHYKSFCSLFPLINSLYRQPFESNSSNLCFQLKFHSAQSHFKQQLLSKAIQNEESQYKKSKSEIETG